MRHDTLIVRGFNPTLPGQCVKRIQREMYIVVVIRFNPTLPGQCVKRNKLASVNIKTYMFQSYLTWTMC